MDITQIILIIVPALLVLITAYILINKLLRSESDRRDFELRKSSLSIVTPIRLRAYERLMLLLERTEPQKLILNLIKPGMTCFELHTALVAGLRQEFSHNVSQQIYVSSELWNAIKQTEQSLLNLINLSASKCPVDGDAAILAEGIIRIYDEEENNPTRVATEILKKEVRQYL